jgi:hypothetical protein
VSSDSEQREQSGERSEHSEHVEEVRAQLFKDIADALIRDEPMPLDVPPSPRTVRALHQRGGRVIE